MTDPGVAAVPEGASPPPGIGWRRSTKALVVDDAARVVLLHVHDPVDRDLGEWWELPGGGLEPGETAEDAVVRELAEETGLLVPRTAVGPGIWTRRATFRWLGRRRWQEETVHAVRLAAPAERVPVAPTEEETASILEVRWVPLADVAGLRTYPGRVAELAPLLLAGEPVDEGFERWS